jgi:hypothetical protein
MVGERRRVKATARLTTRDGGTNVNTKLIPVVVKAAASRGTAIQ